MKTYEVGPESLFRPSTADRIIGPDDKKRSTKTFISTERAGLLLSLLEQHAAGVIKTVQRLHKLEHGEDLDPKAVIEKYPGCKAWNEVHQFIVEHYASTGGFSIQATVRMVQDMMQAERQQTDSSIKTAGEKSG